MDQPRKAGEMEQNGEKRHGGGTQADVQGNAQGGQQGNRQRGEEQRGTFDEADIGSGQKTPGERDTDEQIKTIPPLPRDK